MSLIIPHTYTVDIANGTSRQKILVPMVRGDGSTHRVTVTLLDHGSPAVTTGYTAVLYAVRAGDRITVLNPGTIVGNVVTALILSNSLYVNGRVDLLLKLAKAGDNEISPLWIEAECAGGVTGTYSDPENIISSLSELLAQIGACESATSAAVTAAGEANTAASSVGAAIASAYSASATYAIGDICTYLGSRYKCSTAITVAEAWTAGHWTIETVQTALTSVTSQLTDVANTLQYKTQHLMASEWISGGCWVQSGQSVAVYSDVDYKRHPGIILPAGTYYIKALTGNEIASVFTLVKTNSNNALTRLKDMLSGSPSSYYGAITLASESTVYVSALATKSDIILVNDITPPVSYIEGVYEDIINELVADVDKLQASSGKATYENVSDARVNLATSLIAFGRATVNGMVATVTGQDGGIATAEITPTGNSVRIKVSGTYTVPDLQLLVIRIKPDNTTSYAMSLAVLPLDDGTFNFDYSFDAAYESIYNGYTRFQVLLNSIEYADAGTITISNIEVVDESLFQQSSYYDPVFETMMRNVFNELDTISTPEMSSDIFMRGVTGANYKIQIDGSGGLINVPCVPSKALFLGNSLLAGMTGPNGTYGMCASNDDKDWYYFVSQAILAKNAGATLSKLHDAAFEQAETTAAAETYWTTNAASFASDLDLIIIQIGDNVNNATRRSVFAQKFPWLIGQIRAACPRCRVIVVGVWFNNTEVYSTIQSACAQYGCELIDIRALNTTANQGYVGQTYINAAGETVVVAPTWVSHPGDLGMAAIGDAIIAKLNM